MLDETGCRLVVLPVLVEAHVGPREEAECGELEPRFGEEGGALRTQRDGLRVDVCCPGDCSTYRDDSRLLFRYPGAWFWVFEKYRDSAKQRFMGTTRVDQRRR